MAPATGRTYPAMLRDNVFTFINNVLFVLCAALIALGEVSDAVIAAGVVLGNVVVSLFQEVRTKRTLDRIALLTRPRAAVIRDGREQSVDPAEIVRGDTMIVRPGDQIIVDGPLVSDGELEVDESLLTGESEAVPKRSGDPLYSGSFCVAGSGVYLAEKVGAESFAHKLTAQARGFRRVLTPMQREVNVIVRVILLVAIIFELLLLAETPIYHLTLVASVKMSVVIAKLVPAGLFLSITLAYALGAVRIARRGALVQQVNAVESLSYVDVLCLDKTGTLTANRLELDAVHPVNGVESDLRQLVGNFAASSSSGNRTTAALIEGLGGTKQPIGEEIPFSSERKWSALSFESNSASGSYILGAPEVLDAAVPLPPEMTKRQEELVRGGLRVLLFAHVPEARPLRDAQGEPQLPNDLIPLGLISLSDELRPEARQTLARFVAAGVAPKIISGDNPQTVVALAAQAGLGSNISAVSGRDLEAMDEAQRANAVETATIFGRIAPEQKEDLVRLLKRNGHYVAMIGDGVNDVLSLKAAHLGIAMESGTQATRAVADIILLGDSFAVLPSAVEEGQRIRNGTRDILKLFLTRVLSVALLLMGVMILGGFPFDPKHISILTTFTVGIPSIALAAWAQPGPLPRTGVVRSLIHFVLPAALTLALAGIAVYLYMALTTHHTATGEAQTALTVLAVPCGLLLLPFVSPPTPWWEAGARLSSDWRPGALAGGLFLAFAILLAIEPIRSFFGLVPLEPMTYLIIAGTVAVWAAILRFAWRVSLLDRFLGVDLAPPGPD